MRLIGCIRVSRVNGRAGETFISTDVQRGQVEQYAAVMGHHIVAWVEDLDQPGSTLNRPGIQAALAAVRAGDADGIIAAKLDRITRSMVDLGRLLEWANAENWNLIAVDLGLDLRTPTGRLVGNVLGSVAEWELERRRQDWQIARERAVGRGVHIASRCPTGYRRRGDGRLEPDAAAAAAIVDLFERRAAGDGWKQLADRMTGHAVATPYGNVTWTTGSVTRLIRNRVYLGEARSGQYVKQGAHPPLVTVGLWEAAQTAGIRPVSRNGDRLLLAGVVRCGGCRYVMKADSMRDARGVKIRMYRCRGLHAAGVCAEPSSVLARVIDPFVEERLLVLLAAAGTAEASVTSHELDQGLSELSAAEAELFAFMESDALVIAGRDAFERGLGVRRVRVDEARERVRDGQRRVVRVGGLTPGEIVGAWPDLTGAERGEVVAAALDAVVVFRHRSGRLVDRVLLVPAGVGPVDVPRRGVRVALAPWPYRPGDVGVAAAEDPEPGLFD